MATTLLSTVKDNLFLLIKSLSGSEKRNFKLYVNRLGINSDAKFLSLFVLIDKMDDYDENLILTNKITTKKQLSNLKAHLYKQILISLRLNPINQDNRYIIREQFDFATILHKKGLYKQSLKMLDKVKQFALEHEEKDIVYEIIQLEKVIESQYSNRNNEDKINELIVESQNIRKLNDLASKLYNLNLKIYNMVIKIGYVKNDQEKNDLALLFKNEFPKYEFDELGIREKLLLYNTKLMYAFLVQDFLTCYKYSQKCIDLFYEKSAIIYSNPVWFLKVNSYILECLFILKHKTQFSNILDKLQKTFSSENFPKNDIANSIYFFCLYNSKFNFIFFDYDLKKGIQLVNEFQIVLKKHHDYLDEHRVIVFYYKIATIYFLSGDFINCIAFTDKIIENKELVFRKDILSFSRILNLMAHYEAGMDNDIDKQIVKTYQFLIKVDGLTEVLKEIIKLLKKLASLTPTDLKSEFIKLHTTLKKYEKNRYENRIFLHLDLISWLESKINNKPIATILQEKNSKILR